jgi:4-amino-4-deoxy-L-arabinose transferase-like glycosyltransferase
VAIFVVALAVRLLGIGFGLPFDYHPDEGTSIHESIGLVTGVTDVLSFANPPLYKFSLVGLFEAFIGAPRLVQVDDSVLLLIARVSSAVWGALTVVFLYALGRMARDNRTGLTAAGFGAVTFLLVRESHFGVNDALATLFTTAALAACLRVACRGTRTDYLLAGTGIGLAFASKYQAAAVLVPFALAHLQHGRKRRDVYLLAAAAAALLTAVVAFPQLVTETRRVVGDVYVFLMLPSRIGFEGLDPAGGYVFYLKSFGWGIGWPMLALACLATARAILRRDWPVLCIASLPAVLYVLMGSSHMYVARFLLPGLPAIVTLSAVALTDLASIYAAWIAVGLGALALAGTLPSTLQFDALLTRTDTRAEARAWIQDHLPPDTRVAADPASIVGPPLDGLVVTTPQGRALYDVPLDDYVAQGVQYLVTSSFSADAPNLDPARNARRLDFYASLDHRAQLVADFRPDNGSNPPFVYDRIYGPIDSLDQFDRPGPRIEVYRLG